MAYCLEIESRSSTADVLVWDVKILWSKSQGNMSAGGGGGGRKNLRKRPAAGSDDDADTGSAVIQKAKSASVGPLVASTAKPKKKEDLFYESARTAVPSIGKDNGATAPVLDDEEGSIGSKPAGIQIKSNTYRTWKMFSFSTNALIWPSLFLALIEPTIRFLQRNRFVRQ
jgi:hypothetical protein